ncbi:MAG: Hsp70 family protein [Actinomycetota bacterium]|nr:Hsp70 family protein [Actinomycetota bacterium]
MVARLAVDLGSTTITAAMAVDGHAEILRLGRDGVHAPAVVYVPDSGPLLIGDDAEDRVLWEPHRIARRFTERIGDPAPLHIGGSTWGPDALVAEVLRWIGSLAGRRPDLVVASHPGRWGEHKIGQLGNALRSAAGEVPVELVAAPVAAVYHHLDRGELRAPATVAVGDFGGLGFEASVVRIDDDANVTLAGRSEVLGDVAGADLDHVISGLAAEAVGVDVGLFHSTDRTALEEVDALRRVARDVKHRLSAETAVTFEVRLGGVDREIRITRGEFESRARPVIDRAVRGLDLTVASLGVERDELDAVVLVGGSARVPMLAAATIGALGASIITGVDAAEAVVRGLDVASRASAAVRLPAAGPVPARARSAPDDRRGDAGPAAPPPIDPGRPPPPPPYDPGARRVAPVPAARDADAPGVGGVGAEAAAPERVGIVPDLAARSEAATGLRVAVHLPSGERRPLAAGTWTLGRASTANVRIVDRRVSRWHCELRVGDDGSVVVVDLGSKNGVVVGSERRSVHRLTSTSELLLGPVRVLVEIM